MELNESMYVTYLEHVCMLSCSIVSNSLQLHGLQPTRLLCPWNFPGKNTEVDCHFLLQEIFLTQGTNLHLLHWQVAPRILFQYRYYSSVGKESPTSAGDASSVPCLGGSPGERSGNPLQYSCLENLLDRGAWKATVHGVAKESDKTQRLNNNKFTFYH